MKKKHPFLTSAKAGLAGSIITTTPVVQAANVLWLDASTTSAASAVGVGPVGQWQTLLETSGGHTVSSFDSANFNWNLSTPADVAYVESFDVVILSRTNNLFNVLRLSGESWNSHSTPMINLNPFFTSPNGSGSSSWNWATGGGSTPNVNGAQSLAVLDPTDPILNGITLTPGSPPTVVLTDTNDDNARYYDLNGGTLLPGVTVVAANSGDTDQYHILNAAAGSIQPTGAEQYFIAGSAVAGETGLSADGETAFLNAIDILAIPEPGSIALLSLGGLTLLRRRRHTSAS